MDAAGPPGSIPFGVRKRPCFLAARGRRPSSSCPSCVKTRGMERRSAPHLLVPRLADTGRPLGEGRAPSGAPPGQLCLCARAHLAAVTAQGPRFRSGFGKRFGLTRSAGRPVAVSELLAGTHSGPRRSPLAARVRGCVPRPQAPRRRAVLRPAGPADFAAGPSPRILQRPAETPLVWGEV